MNKCRLKYLLLLILPLLVFATNFDELDKPPEGAYKGQIFFGGSLGLGIPFGDAISAEEDFVAGTTYTFNESEDTKEVDLAHTSFTAFLFGEYMFYDHVGIRSMIDYLSIYQRTLFGSELKNESEQLYYHFGFSLGPNFHLTKRKSWDITLFPFAGYALGQYNAGIVAKELFKDDVVNYKETPSSGLIYGAELSFVFYFSGGFYTSFGANIMNCTISTPDNLKRTSPNPPAEYSSSTSLFTCNILISFGYAYYN